jgi:PEP-CTERM motif-containing protein
MFNRLVAALAFLMLLHSLHQARAAIILEDQFDTYADQAEFQAAWQTVGALPSGVLSTAQSVTPPNSIHNVGTTVAAEANRNQRSFTETGVPDSTLDNVIRFSFDFYDSNAAVQPFRHHSNLQDSPNASASGQLVAMGMNNNQLSTWNGGNYYMGRVLGYNPNEQGATGSGAFFKLNEPGAPLRSAGWHNLAVEISEFDFRFFVDGILSEVVPNTFTLRSYDVVRLGSGLSNAGNEAFYDNVVVETIHQIRPSAWNIDANDNWSGVFSWTGDIPNAPGADAVFGSVITAPRTVTVDTPVKVGRLTFQNENAYSLSGNGPLTLDANTGPAVVNVATGSHSISTPVTLADNTVISVGSEGGLLSLSGAVDASGVSLSKVGPGTLNIDGTLTIGAGTTLTVSAGTANLNSTAGSNTARNLTVNANGAINFGRGQFLAALNVGANGSATVAASGPNNVVTNALTMAGDSTPTGKLDLTNNAVIVDYPAGGPSPDATIRDQIIAGRGGPGLGKTWNGQGITSSQAASDPLNSGSVGYAVNGEMPLGAVSTFRGQPVDESTVLIRYTRTGDANLDGVVNNNDVTILGANYAPGVAKPAWALGDFDYNGFVDNDDVTLLGVYYNPAATPLPSPAGGDNAVAAVPEPSALLLIASGILAVLARGCSRRNR